MPSGLDMLLGEIWRDLRVAWRKLRQQPWTNAAAIASLALGIGANTTVFTIVKAYLLPSLPVAEPRRLIAIYTRDEKLAYYLPNSYPNYLDYRRMTGVFSDLLVQLKTTMVVGRGRAAERVVGEVVSGNYFSLLGVTPALGRAFLAEEDRTPGSHPVAVVSYGLWKRRFGGDPALIGRQIAVNGLSFTVVGVAPDGFRGTAAALAVDVWVPIMMHRAVMSNYASVVDMRNVPFFDVVGRLKPGIGYREAAAAVETLAAQLRQEYPDANKGRTLSTVPLQEAVVDPNQRGVAVLIAGFLQVVVALLLLITCVNLANLLAARLAARRREVGVRVALGATRGRLVRQLLAESLLLSALGGLLGLGFALWATRFIWSLMPPSPIPLRLDLSPDLRVLAFTAALSLATVLVVGLMPALRASQTDVVAALKDDRGDAQRSRRPRLRSFLAVAQLSSSVVLLSVAVLLVRSLQAVQALDPGFNVNGILVVSLEPGLYGYDTDGMRQLYGRALERARELPGVSSATLAARPPLGGFLLRSVVPEGREGGERGTLTQMSIVSTGYFVTLGIPVIEGRDFDERDVQGSPRVAIVNEEFARRYWPGRPALGKRFTLWEQKLDCEVVGVARNSKYNSPAEPAQPFFYLPLGQNASPTMLLHVRVDGDQAANAAALHREMERVDELASLHAVQTLRAQLTASLWLPRMGAALVGYFALLGLVLTVVGVYAVMAGGVAQRRHEIGVRLAVGGTPRHVLGLVLRDGLRLVSLGLALGLLAAVGATRALSGLLFGVRATDAGTFAGAAALLAGTAVAAIWLPARAAARVDPKAALRCD